MSRDWQKEVFELEKLVKDMMEIEKEKKLLIEELKKDVGKLVEELTEKCLIEKKRADQAEAREQKLREEYELAVSGLTESFKNERWSHEQARKRERALLNVIEWVRGRYETTWTYEMGIGEVVDEIITKFDSLYSKEEEPA